MKKAKVDLASESFEAVCNNWEQLVKEFSNMLSDGGIPTLKDAQWTYEKKRINVYPIDESGKKKRGASGMAFRSNAELNRNAANIVWNKFKQFAEEHGLNTIERLRDNEKELGRYDFIAQNEDTGDELTCGIRLLGEWNKPGVHLSMFIGPRYRNEDL